jgi:hypothetical protein
LKRLNLLTNIKIKFLLNCVYKLLWKKEVRTYDGEREDEAIHAKVKAAYDKIYAVAKAGSAKHERQQHLQNQRRS